MNTKQLMIILLLGVAGPLLWSCGEGKISIDPTQYQPRIAIEGYLIPGQPVSRIYVWRNFPVDANLQRLGLALPDADVTITDLASEAVYPLSYRPDSAFFYTFGGGLRIEHGRSYRLDVQATIDGKALTASATTTVPQPGLRIVSVNHDSLPHYPRGPNGEIINFDLEIERSPGTTFYLYTILALDADTSTFVYDNPFSNEEPRDVLDDLDDYRYEYQWIQNTPSHAGRSHMPIFWFDLWFYSDYQVVVWGADHNYSDWLSTYNDVMEEDGNFHEPISHIEGDGIGVFGSAVTDTVYLRVTR